MKRVRRYGLIGVLALVLGFLAIGITRPQCGREAPNIAEPGPLPARGSANGASPQAKALGQSLSKFGFALLLRQAGATGGNVTISPVSLGSVLSMLHIGAKGETERELAQALGIEALDPATVSQGWADLITTAQSGKKTSVTVTNSLWLRDGIPFEPAYLDVNRDYYAADCLPLNDSDNAAVNEINKWVSDRTSGKLPNLLDTLDPGTYLVAVNAVNLKVGWELFDESDTKPEQFTLTDGTGVDVQMMHGTVAAGENKSIDLVQKEDFDAVCLKTDGPVDVWVAVPKGSGTPEDIVRALEEGSGVSDLYREADPYQEVQVNLPRFEFSYRLPSDGLKNDLQAMGIERLFDESAQLSGISDVPTPFFVTSIVHWARIKVDEKGVEAQAATAAQAGCGAGEPPLVRADRPFLVILSESGSQAPLFLAIVRDPR